MIRWALIGEAACHKRATRNGHDPLPGGHQGSRKEETTCDFTRWRAQGFASGEVLKTGGPTRRPDASARESMGPSN